MDASVGLSLCLCVRRVAAVVDVRATCGWMPAQHLQPAADAVAVAAADQAGGMGFNCGRCTDAAERATAALGR